MTYIQCPSCEGAGEVAVTTDLQALERQRVNEVLRQVAEAHGLVVGDMLSPRRTPLLSTARFEASWRLRTMYPDMTLGAIGHYIGGKDHSSVIHGLKRHVQITKQLAV